MGKDYDRRNHTAEHILNGTMVRMFDRGRSFSTHVEKKKSKCDYRFERDLTADEVGELERRVNEVIGSNVPVVEDFLPRTEAAKTFDLDRLPDTAGDPLRIIRIGEYDACPCIGQHVARTGEIGRFSIISTGFEAGVLRVRFRVTPPGEPSGEITRA
jgi:alanyl-tRNA synthetase